MGGKFHLKLNIGERPIANKYREGKMKRTLKRELKVREIVKREALEISIAYAADQLCSVRLVHSAVVLGQHQFWLRISYWKVASRSVIVRDALTGLRTAVR